MGCIECLHWNRDSKVQHDCNFITKQPMMHTNTNLKFLTFASQSSFFSFRTAGRSAIEIPPGLRPSASSNCSRTMGNRIEDRQKRKIIKKIDNNFYKFYHKIAIYMYHRKQLLDSFFQNN